MSEIDTMPGKKKDQNNKELYNLAQKRLVASLLFDGSDATKVFEIVSPSNFGDPKMEAIITAVMMLARQDKEISVLTVARELEQLGKLREVGGTAGLFELSNEGKKYRLEAPAMVYASIVRESSAKDTVNQLIAENKVNFDDDSGVPAAEAIGVLQNSLNESLRGLADDTTLTEVNEYIDDYLDLLDNRKVISETNKDSSDGLQGIPFLSDSINKYTNGWQPEQLITVGAKTGVGKSVFAIMAVVAAARAGKSVLFFSLEMSRSEIIDRIVAAMSGVSLSKLKKGVFDDEEFSRVKKATSELKDMKIKLDTDPGATVNSINSKAVSTAQEPNGLDFIIIDYLQLITPVGRFSSRQEAVADMSRNMKIIAKKLHIPVMVLVQLNRNKSDDEEEKLPTLENIRESAAIAMDSDIVILLHRDVAHDDTTPHTIIIIAKNRHGESNKHIRCHSNLACSMFVEIKSNKDVSDSLSSEELRDLEADDEDLTSDNPFSGFDLSNLSDDDLLDGDFMDHDSLDNEIGNIDLGLED